MNRDALQSFALKPVEQHYTQRDTMLYALGLGCGAADLPFVYEQGPEPLKTLPSMCVVLGHPGFWARDPSLGIDWLKLLHGEHSFELHRPLASQGHVRGEFEIIALEDKGPEKGAIVHQLKTLYDVPSGEKLATVRTVLFLRGDGGCGSFGVAPPPLTALPEAVVTGSKTTPTSPDLALLYRLNGDPNPIHADPVAAVSAGLGKPILHGLCTLGIATRAAVEVVAGGVPERVREVTARFIKPVYPGETICTEFYGTGPQVRFRARVVERDVLVLDRGTVSLTHPS